MRLIMILFLCLIFQNSLDAQLLLSNPTFITESSSNVEITVDASKGNKGLLNYSTVSDVYVHIGVITSRSASPTDWRYVRFTWGSTSGASAAVSLGNNKWRYTITGGLRSFFGITDATETIRRVVILFRNGAGLTVQRNADGTDMYLPVVGSGLQVRIQEPFSQPTFIPSPEPVIKNVGENVNITALASASASMSIIFNGTTVATQSAQQLNASPRITRSGEQKIVVTATDGNLSVRDSLIFFVTDPPAILPLPAGVKDGINYEAGDTSAILVLFAPAKNNIYVLGDFNNWTQSTSFLMNKTADGNRHWIRITGLKPTTEYAYQYLVDGTLKVADYNTEKVLDPDNDPFIPTTTYPGLKAYPTGKTTGIVSVLQTAKTAYNWKHTFTRPDKKNLVVYELLLRDFLQQSNWKTLKDTISYFKGLGINAIHLMPFNEFEGNLSWGYNPSFFFAPDKFYGHENDLRAFIDECHKEGIAVIMDMVLNHAFGQSPMVRMYFDQSTGKPATNSPWFNADARHPFNVGYDFNHESVATRELVDRVVEHWLTKYKIDGFRWDLSKGFTQVNNPNNVSAWGNYDASRVAIWKRIYQKMQSVAPGSYCILEHFADNPEEKELSDAGMLLWGNMNHQFNEATMGYVANADFSGALHTKRGWSNPHLLSYMESHDEERLQYKNTTFGNASGSYSTRTLSTGLKRNEMAAAFWAMMPGPKLMWQFGELGYDFSITFCPSTNTVPTPYPNMSCRTDNKPIRWDYRQDAGRSALYRVYAALIKLKLSPNYASTFTGNNVTYDLTSAVKWMTVISDSLTVVVVGNFDVTTRTASISFPKAGTWFSYLTGTTRTATGAAETISLAPGEYYVFTNRNLLNVVVTSVNDLRPDYSDRSMVIYPNPITSVSKLTFEIPASGRVEASVWSMQGQKLKAVQLGLKAKGKHELSIQDVFKIHSFMSGQYMLILDVNGKRMRKSFIIQ